MKYIINSIKEPEKHLSFSNDFEEYYTNKCWSYYYGWWSHIFDSKEEAQYVIDKYKIDGIVNEMKRGT